MLRRDFLKVVMGASIAPLSLVTKVPPEPLRQEGFCFPAPPQNSLVVMKWSIDHYISYIQKYGSPGNLDINDFVVKTER